MAEEMRPTATAEGPIRVEHRESLVYLLCEACELEHALMAEYLFAAFSLKQAPDDDLTRRQAAAIERWRQVLLSVAAQEMLHLAVANNLLASLGNAPHVERPNFPQQAKHYPPGVQLALLPFGERALRHFLYLERPEGMDLEDASGFALLDAAVPLLEEGELAPRGQQFASVGHLYRGIEAGFHALVERFGEEWVFIGAPRAQATPETFRWPQLIPVTDLASASRAVDTIVEQGEGSGGDWREAHFGRFHQVLEEYLACKADDPGFEPARPVLPVVVRRPIDADAVDIASDPLTREVLDLFNVGYEILLQLVARFFGHGSESDDELQILADSAVDLMFGLIKPLGTAVTRLPVGPEHPGFTAGASFEMFYGTGYLVPHKRAAWILFHERLMELAGACQRVAARPGAPDEVAQVHRTVLDLAGRLAAQVPGLSGRVV